MLLHWEYISSLFSYKSGDELHLLIESTLSQFTWEMYDTLTKNERSVHYINRHAQDCYIFMIVLLQRAQKSEDIELVENAMSAISIFCEYTATLLLRFPDTKELAYDWRNNIILPPTKEMWEVLEVNLHEMPNILQ